MKHIAISDDVHRELKTRAAMDATKMLETADRMILLGLQAAAAADAGDDEPDEQRTRAGADGREYGPIGGRAVASA